MVKAREQLSEEEADQRFMEAIRRAVTTPPLPPRTKAGKPTKPASKAIKNRKNKA
jgi:hypothetical protein